MLLWRGLMLQLILHNLSRRSLVLLLWGLALQSVCLAQEQGKPVRETIAAAVAAPMPDEQREIVLSLKSTPTAEAVEWCEKWKMGGLFIH